MAVNQRVEIVRPLEEIWSYRSGLSGLQPIRGQFHSESRGIAAERQERWGDRKPELSSGAVTRQCAYSHIVITGPMGSGKTSVGKHLSRILQWRFFDSDQHLWSHYGWTGREIAETWSVTRLHQLELESLMSALEEEEPSVIAAAASTADSEAALMAFEKPDVALVVLTCRFDTLAKRVQDGDHRRELDLESFKQLSERRLMALASRNPAVVMDTTFAKPAAAALHIYRQLCNDKPTR